MGVHAKTDSVSVGPVSVAVIEMNGQSRVVDQNLAEK